MIGYMYIQSMQSGKLVLIYSVYTCTFVLAYSALCYISTYYE